MPKRGINIWLEEAEGEALEHPSLVLCMQSTHYAEVTIADNTPAAVAAALAPLLIANLFAQPRHVRPIRKRSAPTPVDIDQLLKDLF